MYQLNRRLIKADGCVINRGSADLEQFALVRQAQIGVLLVDHVTAFRLASILRIDCWAVGGLIASALVTKNHFPPQAEQSWREAL